MINFEKLTIKRDKYFYDVLALWFIFIISYTTWKTLQLRDINVIIDFMEHGNNAYRLSNKIFLFLHDLPVSYYTWIALQFIISLTIVYYLIRPKGKDFILFMLWLSLFPIFYHSIQYILLVMLVKYSNTKASPYLVVSLVFVKEFSVWLALGYLFLTNSRSRAELITSAAISGVLYIGIRLLIGYVPPYENAAPLITPLHLIQTAIYNPATYILIQLLPLVILLLYSVNTEFELKLSLWNALPILLFALLWESQLWFPLFIVIISHRKFHNSRKRKELVTNLIE
ncbi:MAG: hypothetical protein ACW98I_20875 [Candidatus Hodarchaeales archaeon]|jgi:hypothetical protein